MVLKNALTAGKFVKSAHAGMMNLRLYRNVLTDKG